MKLIINTATTFKGGGVQVARSFIEECKKFNDHEYHVVLGNTLAGLIEKNSFPANFHFYEIGFRPATRVFSFKSRDHFFKKIESEIQPDVVFTTSGPAYWRPKAPHLAGYNLPHYIYRDSPYFDRLSMFQRIKWDIKGKIIKYYFNRDADAYVVQTDDVNQRLRKWIESDRVYTVSNTYSHYYQTQPKTDDKLPKKKSEEFRFLTLSAWYAHKNLDIIPEVIEELPDEHRKYIRFILTIPDDIYEEYFPDKYHQYIRNIGPVKPEEGPALYRECDALFLPTLLECFSASYAEAMVMELPIVTTDLGFARSICGDAALYFRAMDAQDAATTIQKLVDDKHLQARLIQQGKKEMQKFDSAEERAKKYLELCKGLSLKNTNQEL